MSIYCVVDIFSVNSQSWLYQTSSTGQDRTGVHSAVIRKYFFETSLYIYFLTSFTFSSGYTLDYFHKNTHKINIMAHIHIYQNSHH